MEYKVLIDEIEPTQWTEYASAFSDYNIYQSWAYQEIRADMDGQKISRAIVKDEEGEVVAMAHVRIKHVESLKLRIGYIQTGPLFFRKDGACGCSADVVGALREAYLGPQVNVLRIAPNIINDPENQGYIQAFEANGFQRL